MKKIHFILLCAVILTVCCALPLAVSASSEPATVSAPSSDLSASDISLSEEPVEEYSECIEVTAPAYAFVGTHVYGSVSVLKGSSSGEFEISCSDNLTASEDTPGAYLVAAPGTGVLTAVGKVNRGCKGTKNVSNTAEVQLLSTQLKLQNTNLVMSVGGSLTPVISYTRGSDSDGIENVDALWTEALQQLANIQPVLTVSGTAVTLSGNQLVANSSGTAVVTATLPGTTASCSFTVTVSPQDNTVPVTTLAIRSTASVKQGETITLVPQYSPANATNAEGAWSLSKSGIVSVEGNVFTGLAVGKVTATYTLADSTKSVSCTITVIKGGDVSVTGVSIANQKNIEVGETVTLTPKFSPADASNQNGTWLLSAEGIVTRYGNDFTGIAAGTVNAIFQSEDGGYVATCKIVVTGEAKPTATPKQNISELTLDQTGTEWIDGVLHITVDGEYDVVYTVTPEDADKTALTWTSSTPAVCTVFGGNIIAMGPGESTITVSFGGETLATIQVVVE